MSRFRKQSQTIWFCEYHIVWGPKYRFRVIQGKVKEEVEVVLREQSRQMECEVGELNGQVDHVHLVVMIPSKLSVSDYMGAGEGQERAAIVQRVSGPAPAALLG